MGLRGRLHLGPALRRLRLPVRSTLVSVVFHAAFGAAVLWGNAVWGGSEPKPVIVNLVPAIAAHHGVPLRVSHAGPPRKEKRTGGGLRAARPAAGVDLGDRARG